MMRLTWSFGLLAALAAVPALGNGPLVNRGSVAKGLLAKGPFSHAKFHRLDARLHGQILDFTHNHGSDRRIWSEALGCKRDLYVYLPPGFDPTTQYPFAYFYHGATQDEQFFLEVVELFDRAVATGELPPFILAAPDGSLQGRPSFFNSASFFANTRAGRFEDWVMQDAWDFMMQTFPIRPEREAHALMGVSMGGSAAFAHAMKHKDRVKIAIGVAPALNLRWVDCHHRYFAPFDPVCWGWRDHVRPLEVIGRPKALIKIRYGSLFAPIAGYGPQAVEEMSRINPIEIIDSYGLQPKELDLFAAYGGKDEFNIAAQVESFLFRAKERNIDVGVAYDPEGRHDVESGQKLMPEAIRWVAPLVTPYGPKR